MHTTEKGRITELLGEAGREPVIDFDANATTRLDPRVVRAMTEVLERFWGNPASDSQLGKEAAALVAAARSSVAALVGAGEDEIVFTGSATEAINMALQGAVRRGAHVISSAVEHKAVLETLEFLHRSRGAEVTLLRPDSYGRVTAAAVRAALRDETALVCLAHGNNEIGTLNPVEEIGRTLRSHPALFFVDADQTAGYFPPQVAECRVDLMALSGHKIHGPKGAAALYIRHGVRLLPLMHGGGQEAGYRPGTLDVPAIVGFAVAAEVAAAEGRGRAAEVTRLRLLLLERLTRALPDVKLNGHPTERLPGNLSLTIPYVEAQTLQRRLPGVAFSRGSACASSSGEPSHVLRAIGLTEKELYWTVRLGLSCFNTEEEVERAAREMIEVVSRLRDAQAR